MKLYWARKSRSSRIVWLLEEIGQPYERAEVDIRSGEQTDPALLKVNPMGKVPALVDGQATVSESGAIVAYLADRFPEAGLAPPIGDPQRGQYLKWLFFSGNCIEAALGEKFANLQVPYVTAGWGSFERVVAVLEQALQDRPWLLGERFTAADVLIGSDLHFAVEGVRAIEPRPAFTTYLQRCQARPAFQRAQRIDAG